MIKTPDVLVAQLTPTRRVMADDLQWIVQDLYGDKWRPVAYCRYRDTILERFLPRETHFSVVEALKALPAILWGEEEAKPALATPGRALEAESLMDEPPFEAILP